MLDDFKFGVATSAYQIEGAWNQDGKVPSIWDEISHNNDKRFKVNNDHTGDIACDHYHQWDTDIELMKALGIQAYRFSISWSRICTSDCMCSNLKGIQFYQKLVKKLLENNIEPFVTLYHWDMPKWLNDRGGWNNPKSIQYFKCYADTMYNALPDVKHWITFNEPAVFINNYWGHNMGHLPTAIKNVLLSHGEAVERYNGDGKIGISLNLMPIFPVEYGTKDETIAVKNLDKIHNKLWLDPIYNGKFPDDINKLYGFKKQLKLTKKQIETISQPIDFIGVNYYTALRVKYNPYKPPTFIEIVRNKTATEDLMGTESNPFGLYEICQSLQKEYNNPEIYITENGCACSDTFVHDKKIHDYERIRYIRSHLRYCNQTVKKGIKLKGYFYWSFMDNFEWLQGYNKRFGLIYIFYPTQSRVCKDSFHWYHKIINDKIYREKQLEGL